MGSALFNIGGGGPSSEGPNPDAPKKPFTVPNDATPQQIMEAWKQNLLANHESPDEALTELFQSKR